MVNHLDHEITQLPRVCSGNFLRFAAGQQFFCNGKLLSEQTLFQTSFLRNVHAALNWMSAICITTSCDMPLAQIPQSQPKWFRPPEESCGGIRGESVS